MPIYEYRCQDCGRRFDRFFRSAEQAEKEEKEIKCPDCGSTVVRKLFSLLGTGWTMGSRMSGSCGTKPT